MLGNTPDMIQTGPFGKQINRIYTSDGAFDIDREFYLGLLVDRARGRSAMIARFRGR